MKRSFFISFFSALLMNCTAEAQQLHIDATADANATQGYIIDSDNPQEPLKTVKVTDGKFSADIPHKDGQLLFIGTDSRYQQMVFNDGSEVSVDVVNDVVKGSGLNEKWGKYLAEMNGLKGQVDAQKKLLINTCKNNTENKIPVAAIMLGNELLSSEVLAEVLTDDAPYAKHPFLAQIVMIKKSMEKRMPGSMLKDISIPDADGKMYKLSDFVGKGKYVLVDFWASWCGPCCREMPNVVAAYNEYKSKGFEIVGVSLDQNKDKWLGKVKELGMTWPQLSDLKGWKCEAAALYGVQAIPSNVLFDKEGKIVATDLMGNQLQDKLQEIFK